MKKLLPIPVLFLFFLGCEGSTGPTGPAGENGNANIQVYQFSFTSNDLIQYIDQRVYTFSYDFGVSTENAAVNIYFTSLQTSWYQLPMSEPTFDLSISYYFSGPQFLFDFRTGTGNARSKFIQYMNNDTDYICKLVLIPSN